MYAYELLPKLTYLTLSGQNNDGELEFIGTRSQWYIADVMEQQLSHGY